MIYAEPVTAPAVADGIVYIGYTISADGSHFQSSIAAFHASDGTLLWQRPDPIGAAGLVAAGQLFMSTSGVRDRCHISHSQISPDLIAWSETTGHESWNRMLETVR